MHDYKVPFGKAVKRARTELGLSQHEVAEKIEVDVRSIISIEKFRSNTQLKILFPLIRALKIDPREIFFPESFVESSLRKKTRLILDDCSEKELTAILPTIDAVLKTLRSSDTTDIK